MAAKGIYELYDKETFLGEFTAEEIGKITGARKEHIASYAANPEGKFYKRYRVVPTEDTVLTKSDWPLLMDFEFTTKKILYLCGKGIKHGKGHRSGQKG